MHNWNNITKCHLRLIDALAKHAATFAGLLLAAYFINASTTKTIFIQIGVLSAGIWLVLTPKEKFHFNKYDILVLLFSMFYSASAFFHYEENAFVSNLYYPLLAAAVILLKPAHSRNFLFGFYIGLIAVVLIGWYRFITYDSGLMSEHLLGYWGIKFTQSTRNNDALVPLLLVVYGLSILRIKSNGTLWALALFSIAIAFPALMLSMSRGSWLGAATFLILYLIFILRDRSINGFVTMIGLPLFVLLLLSFVDEHTFNIVTDRFVSIYDPSVAASSSNLERVSLLKYGIELGLRNPIVGIGARNFACCLKDMGFPGEGLFQHPENFFLHMIDAVGFPATLMLCLMMAIAIVGGLRKSALCKEAYFSASCLSALFVYLQMNSELSSLVVWLNIATLTISALNKPGINS